MLGNLKASEDALVLWNQKIRAHARNGWVTGTFQLFSQMQEEGVVPDKSTYAGVLSLCAGAGAVSAGRRIHACMVRSPLETEVVIGNCLLNLYGKSGSKEAMDVFNCMSERNLVSWSSMIAVHAKHGEGNIALQLLRRMQQEGVKPNRVTFISSLSACSDQLAIAEGKRLHARIHEAGSISDLVMGTALMNMYGKCGKLTDAQDIFNRLARRDLVSWNTIIAVYAQHQQVMTALCMFAQMQKEGFTPDHITFTTLVDACSDPTVIAEGKKLHSCIVERGYESNVSLGAAFVNMYGKSGSLEDVCQVFKCLEKRNLVSWNALISVHNQQESGMDALQFLHLMQQDGVSPDRITFVSLLYSFTSQVSDVEGRLVHGFIIEESLEGETVVGNALIDLYGKCGSIADAQNVFCRIPIRDVISWTTMIATIAQEGHSKEAMILFDEMQEKGIHPDKLAFTSGLSACISDTGFSECERMHAHIMDSGIELDIQLRNALVTMYAKCGSLVSSLEVFNTMSERDIVSWNSIIAAFAQHGWGKEALCFYQQMQHDRIKPDKFTFVNVLLACSHAGLLDEGCHVFVSMNHQYGMTTDADHHDCLMGLFGRAGCLREAETLVYNMPFQPTVLSFLTLICLCRDLSDVEKGELLASYISELDSENSASYVILSNIYAVAGGMVDATKIGHKMRDVDTQQLPNWGTSDLGMELVNCQLEVNQEEGAFATIQR